MQLEYSWIRDIAYQKFCIHQIVKNSKLPDQIFADMTERIQETGLTADAIIKYHSERMFGCPDKSTFLANEYRDRTLMRHLLSEEDFACYEKDIVMLNQVPSLYVSTDTGILTAEPITDDGYSGICVYLQKPGDIKRKIYQITCKSGEMTSQSMIY